MKTMRWTTATVLVVWLAALTLEGCGSEEASPVDMSAPEEQLEGWTEQTHSKDATPNYLEVFAQNQVKRIDIRLSAANWAAMLDDMEALYGPRGGSEVSGPPRGPGPGSPPPEALEACRSLASGDGCTVMVASEAHLGECTAVGPDLACVPEGMAPPSHDPPPSSMVQDPVWVPCDVVFEGRLWSNVGLRFKGNSTLKDTWEKGGLKLPLKLDFDQFEDEFPELEDQRFFGFKRLALANGAMDASLLRDKVAGDVFREAGVPAPWRSFYRVFIDFGDGPTFFGLYTMAEVPDKPMFNTQFGGVGGNLYKPDLVEGAWTASGPVDDVAFTKKNHEDDADWSDIEATIGALHADHEDSSAWLEELERHLDVDGFLRWLAVNTVIQDWDTYGNMNHNYYLYGDPGADGRLSWIPWDHNMAFADGIGRAPALPLDMAGVDDQWPLIRILLDDATCRQRYFDFVEAFDGGVFDTNAMAERFQREHDLIESYVVGADGERAPYTCLESATAFASSVEELNAHVQGRHAAVADVLSAR